MRTDSPSPPLYPRPPTEPVAWAHLHPLAAIGGPQPQMLLPLLPDTLFPLPGPLVTRASGRRKEKWPLLPRPQPTPASLLEAPGQPALPSMSSSWVSRRERLCCYGVSDQLQHVSLCRGRPGPLGWPCEPLCPH